MWIETLLLLISLATLVMAVAMLPVLGIARSNGDSPGFWVLGCMAFGVAGTFQELDRVLPVTASEFLSDGVRLLAATLLAQAVYLLPSKSTNRLTPLWLITFLLAGYFLGIFFPALFSFRRLLASFLIAWALWRAARHIFSPSRVPHATLGLALFLLGLMDLQGTVTSYLQGNSGGLAPEAELAGQFLAFTTLLFATILFLTVFFDSQLHSAVRQSVEDQRDPVTDCLNRRAIDAHLEREFAIHQMIDAPLTVLMIDIDHFKAVNDTHGHLAGDEALRSIASALRQQVRATDSVGRFGGDEFLVILPRTTSQEAEQVVRRMHKALENLPDQPAPISISVGVAQRQPTDRPNTLIARADSALYAAKQQDCDQPVADLSAPSAT